MPVKWRHTFSAILADEARPRDGQRLSLHSLPRQPVPVTYLDGEFTIGEIRDFQLFDALKGTEGRCLVGIGQLYATALAEIVWPAINDGLPRGLCVQAFGPSSGDTMIFRDASRVMLGGRENNCLANAGIVDAWEGL